MNATTAFYSRLNHQVEGLLSGETDFIANCANLSALLFMEMERINWAGVYLLKDEALVLGPFQGKPACTRIPMGQGVCGKAASVRETVLVDDVHAFDGHIACDGASNSEIVVPLIKDGVLMGVLDIDSPHFSRFDQDDQAGLEQIALTLLATLRLPG